MGPTVVVQYPNVMINVFNDNLEESAHQCIEVYRDVR